MKQTVLHSSHITLGAKMVPFSGWEMPLFYTSALQEHRQVRETGGMFDVSHMGRLDVMGKDAGQFLDRLSVRPLSSRPNHSATYTVFCQENGGTIDDLIVYKLNQEHYFFVANASNRDKDLEHLTSHIGGDEVKLISKYDTDAILAVQGPETVQLIKQVFPQLPEMAPMHLHQMGDLCVASTGYTGEKGFEIFGSHVSIRQLWDTLLSKGLSPVGLAARDTLRLEMGYALYGHELSEEISPVESVAHWVVQFDNRDFIGKEALLKIQEHFRHPYGMIMEKGAIPREGFAVRCGDQILGKVTSGAFSPTINAPIALILLDGRVEEGDQVEINIRDQWRKGQISPLPFIRKRK